MMHNRHFMDLLVSAHYGEIIVSWDVVMSRIGGGIVGSRLCFDIALIVRGIMSVVFVNFLANRVSPVEEAVIAGGFKLIKVGLQINYS